MDTEIPTGGESARPRRLTGNKCQRPPRESASIVNEASFDPSSRASLIREEMQAEAEAVVAPIEVEPLAASVTAHLHVPPLASLPAGQIAGGPQVLAQQAPSGGVQRPPYSFKQFANGLGLSCFTAALEAADLLTNYVDSCETALTIFAPSDEAFTRLGPLPEDMQARASPPTPSSAPPPAHRTRRILQCLHRSPSCLAPQQLPPPCPTRDIAWSPLCAWPTYAAPPLPLRLPACTPLPTTLAPRLASGASRAPVRAYHPGLALARRAAQHALHHDHLAADAPRGERKKKT